DFMSRTDGLQPYTKISTFTGQIWVVVWILKQSCTPTFVHVGDFCGIQAIAARCRFMMVKLGIWRANDPVTGFPEPQTKVNIVEGDGELLDESPDRLENSNKNHHASSRHGGVVAHRSGDPELMVCATWKTREWMPRNTAQS